MSRIVIKRRVKCLNCGKIHLINTESKENRCYDCRSSRYEIIEDNIEVVVKKVRCLNCGYVKETRAKNKTMCTKCGSTRFEDIKEGDNETKNTDIKGGINDMNTRKKFPYIKKEENIKEETDENGDFHLKSAKSIPLTGEDLYRTEQLINQGIAKNVPELYRNATTVLQKIIEGEGDSKMVDIKINKENSANPLDELSKMAQDQIKMKMTEKILDRMGDNKPQENKETKPNTDSSIKDLIEEMREQVKLKNLKKMLNEGEDNMFNLKEMMQTMMMMKMMESMVEKKQDNNNQVLEMLKTLNPVNKPSPELEFLKQQLSNIENERKQQILMQQFESKLSSVDKKDDLKDFVKQVMENNKKSEIDLLKEQISAQKERVLMGRVETLQRQLEDYKQSPSGTRDFRGLIAELREVRELAKELDPNSNHSGPGIMEALGGLVESAAPILQAAIERGGRQKINNPQHHLAQNNRLLAQKDKDVVSTNTTEESYSIRTIPEPDGELSQPEKTQYKDKSINPDIQEQEE